jgi:hypothetical protein
MIWKRKRAPVATPAKLVPVDAPAELDLTKLTDAQVQALYSAAAQLADRWQRVLAGLARRYQDLSARGY